MRYGRYPLAIRHLPFAPFRSVYHRHWFQRNRGSAVESHTISPPCTLPGPVLEWRLWQAFMIQNFLQS